MIRIFAGMTLILFIASCSVDQNEQANKLFVEAQQLIEVAVNKKAGERISSLQAAEVKLKSIVSSYPSSNLAVKFSSGQSVGDISLKMVSEAIQDARWVRCMNVPNRKCLFDRALFSAQKVNSITIPKIDLSTATIGTQQVSSEVIRIAVLSNIADMQIRAGLKEEANYTVKQIFELSKSIKYNEKRASILLTIGKFYMKAGRKKEAQYTIEQGYEIIQSFQNLRKRSEYMSNIAIYYAETGLRNKAMGLFEKAISVAELVVENDKRIEAILEIAKAQMKVGLKKKGAATFQQAVHVASSITDNEKKISQLSEVAILQAKAGLKLESAASFDQALAIVQLFKDPKNKTKYASLLSDVAVSQSEAGFKRDASTILYHALDIANSVQWDIMRTSARTSIAQAMAKAGLFRKAIEIAESKEVYPELVLTKIGLEQAKAGLVNEALATLEKAKEVVDSSEESERKWKYFEIGQAQMRIVKTLLLNRRLSDAIQLANSIEDKRSRGFALSEIDQKQTDYVTKNAKSQVKAGNFTEALKLVQEIKDDDQKVWTLIDIAKAQIKQGMEKEAQASLDQALHISALIENKERRASKLSSIAVVKAQSGRPVEALKLAQSIELRHERASAFARIAVEILE